MPNRNQRYLQQAFSRKAASYSKADFLHAELRYRLLERLQLFTHQPETILVLGGGGGELAAALSQQYPAANCLSVDSSAGMTEQAQQRCNALCADLLALPLAADSIDLIVSNFTLQYCADQQAGLLPALREINRVLKPDGLLLISFPGNQSFPEYRSAIADDGYLHLDPLPDLQRAGDAMLQAGLQNPVLDSEQLTITYDTFDKAIAELRAVSASALVSRRRPGLGGKHYWATTRQRYEALRTAEGLLPVSLEIVYAQARGGQLPVERSRPAEVGVPLSRLLGRGPRKMTSDDET
jgi:malonyl-CoA O-methyltransferase